MGSTLQAGKLAEIDLKEKTADALGQRAQPTSAHHDKVGRQGLDLPQQFLPLAHVRHDNLRLKPHLCGEVVSCEWCGLTIHQTGYNDHTG